MDPSSCEILHEEKNSKLKVDRVHANFPPSLWGRYFANFSLNKELWEKYSTEVERLKEQVKIMLMNQEQEPLDKMTFIDILERLGVAYHFEDEIEQLLQKLFGTFDYNDDYDLYNIALHFRIFRQHGYNISCDVFNKFKGSDGILKENLSNDVMGMLSLYEAANLAKEGDDILDEALILTKTSLQNLLPTLTSSLAVQVKQAMDLCLHRTLPRIAARNYIDTYEKDPLRDEILLYFAKIDYNLLQLLHHQELSAITRWWDDLVTNFPYARDRIVEVYFWCLGIYFEPHYATYRIALTKVIGMLSIIDDTFDSYGTLDELKHFRDAAERWDADAIELLPDYLKLLYKSMLDLFESLDMEFMIQGRFSGVSTVKQDIQEIIRSYYLETKWFVEGHMPSFDEYLRNGLVTSTVFSLISASFLGMRGSTTNEEAFEWLRTKPKALIACATLTRLIDDLGTYEANQDFEEIIRNGAIKKPEVETHFPVKSSHNDENVGKEIQMMEKPALATHSSGTGGGGTRAGLFRTPISGGVQSATSAHGLPRPALAVRNLMEQARFAHLCTVMSQMHHRREGYPFGSLVDFATDSMGHPIFSFSPLAIHTRNLLKDPRCSLVVQIPGWSGLSNARVTILGDVFALSENQQEWAHKQYLTKHHQGPSQQWGNFYYFRMQNITDIYFIGGFGTVAWVDVKEYEALQPDKIAVDGGEQNLKELNATFCKPLKELLSAELEVDDAALISIDSKGVDIRVRQGAQFNIQRISFDEGHPVETLEEAKAALWKLIEKGRVYNLPK